MGENVRNQSVLRCALRDEINPAVVRWVFIIYKYEVKFMHVASIESFTSLIVT